LQKLQRDVYDLSVISGLHICQNLLQPQCWIVLPKDKGKGIYHLLIYKMFRIHTSNKEMVSANKTYNLPNFYKQKNTAVQQTMLNMYLYFSKTSEQCDKKKF